jgi:hypothetical protein
MPVAQPIGTWRIRTVTRGPVTIEDSDLARAWVRALVALCERGVQELTPLIVSATGRDGGSPTDNPAIERALDAALIAAGKYPTHTVANTIFPMGLWNPAAPRQVLFDRYVALLPRLKRVPQNRLGTYFERLVAFSPGGHNQLERIISTYQRGIHRRSAMQASLFDPLRDQTAQPRRGFPCLQQVAFVPIEEDGIGVTGFYATQYILDRGYGNYLGLARLGAFMAHELGRRLRQVVCIAAVAQLGQNVALASARNLRDQLRPAVELGAPAGSTAQAIEGAAP